MSRASTPNSSKHHAGLLITIGVTPIHVRARGASAWKIARKRVESRPPSDPGSTVPEHKKHKFFVILTKLAAIAGHVMPIRRYEPLNRRVSTTMNGLATDFLSGYHYEARVARTVSPGRRASHRRPRCVLSPDGRGVDLARRPVGVGSCFCGFGHDRDDSACYPAPPTSTHPIASGAGPNEMTDSMRILAVMNLKRRLTFDLTEEGGLLGFGRLTPPSSRATPGRPGRTR